jgi:hypothetical protein
MIFTDELSLPMLMRIKGFCVGAGVISRAICAVWTGKRGIIAACFK